MSCLRRRGRGGGAFASLHNFGANRCTLRCFTRATPALAPPRVGKFRVGGVLVGGGNRHVQLQTENTYPHVEVGGWGRELFGY